MNRRGGGKRALGSRRPMVAPEGSNQRWSLDFVSVAVTDQLRFRILAVVDDLTRDRLALVPDTSLSSSGSRGSSAVRSTAPRSRPMSSTCWCRNSAPVPS